MVDDVACVPAAHDAAPAERRGAAERVGRVPVLDLGVLGRDVVPAEARRIDVAGACDPARDVRAAPLAGLPVCGAPRAAPRRGRRAGRRRAAVCAAAPRGAAAPRQLLDGRSHLSEHHEPDPLHHLPPAGGHDPGEALPQKDAVQHRARAVPVLHLAALLLGLPGARRTLCAPGPPRVQLDVPRLAHRRVRGVAHRGDALLARALRPRPRRGLAARDDRQHRRAAERRRGAPARHRPPRGALCARRVRAARCAAARARCGAALPAHDARREQQYAGRAVCAGAPRDQPQAVAAAHRAAARAPRGTHAPACDARRRAGRERRRAAGARPAVAARAVPRHIYRRGPRELPVPRLRRRPHARRRRAARPPAAGRGIRRARAGRARLPRRALLLPARGACAAPRG